MTGVTIYAVCQTGIFRITPNGNIEAAWHIAINLIRLSWQFWVILILAIIIASTSEKDLHPIVFP